MSTSTDLVEQDADQQALVASADEVNRQLAAQQEEEYDDEPLVTPILKIGQGLTKEVQEGDAAAGEFINTLTNEPLSDTVDLIVAYFSKGRFASDKKTKRAFSAFGDTIPPHWADLVGDKFVGTPFVEYPDAEEEYRAATKRGDFEWGSGPQVSTTHNFTGFVVIEIDGEETTYEPVRLSLQRTNMPAVRKIKTLNKLKLRNKAWWDVVFRLSTEQKTFNSGDRAYIINPTDVRIVRDTTPQEKAQAAELALAVAGDRTKDNAESAAVEDRAEPAPVEGALAV